MKTYIEECRLMDEQRSLILQGIQEGKTECQTLKSLLPVFTTNTYAPRLQYDSVNTHVEKQIQNNPHTQMKVLKKKAGFHPYIVIHDTIRNVFILVLKLHKKNYIFTPSKYRGDFASSNYARLIEMGAPRDELLDENPFQEFFSLGAINQPFGIVVAYDGESDTVFEGALRPDQSDWIYKEDITHCIIANTGNVIPVNSYVTSDLEPTLKRKMDEVDIEVKLKDSK